MKEIPLLTARDIDCRVQSVSRNKRGEVGAVLLLYKDARVDMRILDEVYGATNWQRTHQLIDGNLYCTISIWDEDKKMWVQKQDVGTESNTEKEKGQASDSFKRAGFNVGIGRELYTAPFIYVALDEGEWYEGKDGKPKCSAFTRFKVKSIGYDERREINELTIVDNRGNVRYATGTPKQTKPTEYKCSECGKAITPAIGKSGKPISLNAHIDRCLEKYGTPLCCECIAKKETK